MNIPESCVIIERIKNDGKDPDAVRAAVNTGTNEEIQHTLTKLGFDSLDVVELGMEAEECAQCESGSGTAHCNIGALLIELSQ